MRDLQERRYFRRLLRSPLFAVFLSVLFLLLCNSVYRIYRKDEVARLNRIESDKRLAALKEKEEYLKTQISKLKTSRGVEEELRNKFQVTKDGEEVLVVVDDPGTTGDISRSPRDNGSMWDKFLKLIGF
ncbi:MAG: hypothetical protein HY226_05285 [Candidatus Vogelbacteria bacterium]|nr:hypothetical protein [Candidatus Vogelbacteria bacterium]